MSDEQLLKMIEFLSKPEIKNLVKKADEEKDPLKRLGIAAEAEKLCKDI